VIYVVARTHKIRMIARPRIRERIDHGAFERMSRPIVVRLGLLLAAYLLLSTCAFRSSPTVAVVTTFAGSGTTGPLGGGYADRLAAHAQFRDPIALAFGPDGTLYVSDSRNHRIRRVSPDGSVTSVAGSGPTIIYGINAPLIDGPADRVTFNDPSDVVSIRRACCM